MGNKKFTPEFGKGTFYEEEVNSYKYYVYEWSTPDKRRNPRKRFPFTAEGRKAREVFAKDVISKMEAGVQTRSDETFGEWLLFYLENYRKTGVGSDTYNRFLQYASNIPTSVANTLLDKLKGEQLQEMITGMLTGPCYRRDGKHKPLSHSTCKKIYELIFASLEKARILRKIKFNPMESVDKPTTEQKEKQIFSNSELKRFLKALRVLSKGRYRKRMRTDYLNLFFFLYCFGFRIGELLALQFDDIDLDNQVIRVHQSKKSNRAGQVFGNPKTVKGTRTVPILSDSAFNRLVQMKSESVNKKYLFTTKSGTALGYFQVQRTFQAICELAGIKKTLHEFRHTYGTRMARAVGTDGRPMPIAELSRIMGHSKISTTQNFYVHSDEEQNEALLKSFSNPARRKLPKKAEKK